MSKSKYKPEDLYESILVTAEIMCSSCDSTDNVAVGDEYEALDYFFEEGWRATKNGNTYCPSCTAKKLKSK